MGPYLFDASEVEGTDYRTRLDATDKFVLHKIDSFIQTEKEKSDRFSLCKRNIKGFRRVNYYSDSSNAQ
jgi:hypothetical protein